MGSQTFSAWSSAAPSQSTRTRTAALSGSHERAEYQYFKRAVTDEGSRGVGEAHFVLAQRSGNALHPRLSPLHPSPPPFFYVQCIAEVSCKGDAIPSHLSSYCQTWQLGLLMDPEV